MSGASSRSTRCKACRTPYQQMYGTVHHGLMPLATQNPMTTLAPWMMDEMAPIEPIELAKLRLDMLKFLMPLGQGKNLNEIMSAAKHVEVYLLRPIDKKQDLPIPANLLSNDKSHLLKE